MNQTTKFTAAVFAALLSTSLFFASSARAEIKIGYVDLRKALQDTSAGKKAQKDLKKEYDAKKEELEKKEKDLKAMNDDLDKKKLVLSDEVKQKKQIELQQEMGKFQQQVQATQAALQKKEREMTQPILEKLQELLDIEFFNALFVIPRSVGFISHFMEQKRNDEGLFRLPEELLFIRKTDNMTDKKRPRS